MFVRTYSAKVSKVGYLTTKRKLCDWGFAEEVRNNTKTKEGLA